MFPEANSRALHKHVYLYYNNIIILYKYYLFYKLYIYNKIYIIIYKLQKFYNKILMYFYIYSIFLYIILIQISFPIKKYHGFLCQIVLHVNMIFFTNMKNMCNIISNKNCNQYLIQFTFFFKNKFLSSSIVEIIYIIYSKIYNINYKLQSSTFYNKNLYIFVYICHDINLISELKNIMNFFYIKHIHIE